MNTRQIQNDIKRKEDFNLYQKKLIRVLKVMTIDDYDNLPEEARSIFIRLGPLLQTVFRLH